MIDIGHKILKATRKLYVKLSGFSGNDKYNFKDELAEARDLILYYLSRNEPCMIARYGANELACVLNYLSIQNNNHKTWDYIIGKTSEWWWNPNMVNQMQNNAGFFPPTEDNLARFSELMIEDSLQVDVLGIYESVKNGVSRIKKYLPSSVRYIHLNDMNPFVSSSPWSKALRGKKVLVIHPFSELIESQYQKRGQLFRNSDVLPEFELTTIKAVQSIGGIVDGDFSDWFMALNWMKQEMDKKKYDIALIGCGAYGFPLAAHAKRTGHHAIHMGGALQLLFGIKGKRWENPLFLTEDGQTYKELMDNPAWVRPEQYMTEQAKKVEDACYW